MIKAQIDIQCNDLGFLFSTVESPPTPCSDSQVLLHMPCQMALTSHSYCPSSISGHLCLLPMPPVVHGLFRRIHSIHWTSFTDTCRGNYTPLWAFFSEKETSAAVTSRRKL